MSVQLNISSRSINSDTFATCYADEILIRNDKKITPDSKIIVGDDLSFSTS